MRWLSLLVAPALAAVVAAPASADSDDDSFVHFLSMFDFDYHGQTHAQAMSAGREVCHALDTGVSFQKVNDLAYQYFGHDDASTFVAASVSAYCSEYKPVIQRLASEGR